MRPLPLGNHLHRAFDATDAGLFFFGALDGFDVLAPMGIAEGAPAIPRGGISSVT